MLRSPLKPLSSAALLFLLCCSPARAQDSFLMENHPGFWVEWLHQTSSTIADVALGDVDSDGAPDLFVVDGSSLELWRNNGRGEFVPDPDPVSPIALHSILAFDVDGDARLDLLGAVPGSPGGIAFFKGLGGGRFAAPVISATGTNYGKLVGIDIDGIGPLEVVAGVSHPGAGLHVLGWDGNGFRVTANLIPTAPVIEICVTDLNGDGRQDLVAGADGQPWRNLVMFLNDGRTLEGLVTVPNPHEFRTIISCDADGDGDQDLLLDAYSSVLLLRGNGTGRDWEWVPIPGDFGSNPLGIQVADLDRDDHPELLIAWALGHHGTFLGSFDLRTDPGLTSGRSLTYTHSLGQQLVPPDRMVVADLNRDQRPDLLLVSSIGPSYSSYSFSRQQGMIGVLLNHNGVPGGIHLAPADVPASSIAAARFDPSRPPEIVLGGPAGLFLASPRRDGTLAPSRRIGDGGNLRVVDLNHDGRDDLIVGMADGTTEVRFTRPNGAWTIAGQFQGRVIDVGDLDDDHRADLLVRRADGNLDIVWAGPGHRFDRASPTGLSDPLSSQVLVGDADGDGRNELIECRFHPLGYDQNQSSLSDTILTYHCSPRGRLRLEHRSVVPQIIPRDHTYMGRAKAADIDGVRGDEILVVIAGSSSNGGLLRVLRAIGDGGYELGSEASVIGEGPDGPVLADLDGDGDLDAVCIGNYEGADGLLQVRWNDGRGNLTGTWGRRIANARIFGIAASDIDGDGAADLAVIAMPHYETGTRIALLYGRRDEVSARTSHTDFASAPEPSVAGRFAIGDIRPNPAHDRFTIQWTSSSREPITVDLHDVAGRRVRIAQISGSQPGQGETRFESLSELPAGLYWVRLRQGHFTATKRVALIR